jgi:hypothetical protein
MEASVSCPAPRTPASDETRASRAGRSSPSSLLRLWTSRSAASLAGRSRMRCKAMSCAALRAAGCSIAAATRAQRGPREWTPKRRRHSRGLRSAGGCPRIAWPLELCSDLLFARTRVKSIGNRWCLESVPNVAGDRHPGCALKSAGGPEDAAARNSSGVAENGVSAAANARNRAVRRRYSRSLRRICGGCQAAESRIGTEIRGPMPTRNPGDRSIGRLPPFIAVGLCARYGAASSACAVCASPVRGSAFRRVSGCWATPTFGG